MHNSRGGITCIIAEVHHMLQQQRWKAHAATAEVHKPIVTCIIAEVHHMHNSRGGNQHASIAEVHHMLQQQRWEAAATAEVTNL